MKTRWMAVLGCLAGITLGGSAMAQLVAAPQATLPTCVAGDGPIYDTEVEAAIRRNIPACAPKLIIMTQCYGGDFLNDFAMSANTTVLTAGQPGAVTYYGGYHDDAARGLRPGAGRTAMDVHTAGTDGKDAREMPKTGGTVAPGGFSLEPITPTSAVQSRHVLVYAGKPNAQDDADRDAIINNFAGQMNTTVHTVGAMGAANGYQRPASHAGLSGALREIGGLIAEAPDPCAEQFIFFVTDHGDIHRVRPNVNSVAPPGQSATVPMPCMVAGFDCDPTDLLADPMNETSFSFFVPLHDVGIIHNPLDGPLWLPGTLQCGLFTGMFGLTVPAHDEHYNDIGSGLVGDQPGEGAWLRFRVPEPVFVESFFDVFVQISLLNQSLLPVPIDRVSQDAGVIQRPAGDVGCPADFNGDGNVDPDDLGDFINCFFEIPPCNRADFNGDGNVDPDDLGDFINVFFGPPC
ncbi:MAG: hypothetical protein AB7K52_05565 [Phycisphaerales bacterium]